MNDPGNAAGNSAADEVIGKAQEIEPVPERAQDDIAKIEAANRLREDPAEHVVFEDGKFYYRPPDRRAAWQPCAHRSKRKGTRCDAAPPAM